MSQTAKRTVIITGGIKGLGKAMALELAKQNYNLVLNYFSDDRTAQETLDTCKQLTSNVMLFKGDVSRRSEVEAMMSATTERFGSLDVLINNAGLNIDKPLHQLSDEDWDRVVDSNMKSVFLCSQAASVVMQQQPGEGIILNLSASTGITGRKNGLNYCASKAGVLVMTKCLALELGPKIHVNCILPGLIKTGETTERFDLDDPASLEKHEQSIPLKRIGQPEEIATMVSFLLSPAASYITGQNFSVNGGSFMN
ncbi:MAG TPA: 3-oxoacyl-ACP reductase family protein [Ktedonobacteraceae bacterium]|nr:3-oxoacyl-ACP reductase family protein [Ktedonobacteraceae bacterium]